VAVVCAAEEVVLLVVAGWVVEVVVTERELVVLIVVVSVAMLAGVVGLGVFSGTLVVATVLRADLLVVAGGLLVVRAARIGVAGPDVVVARVVEAVPLGFSGNESMLGLACVKSCAASPTRFTGAALSTTLDAITAAVATKIAAPTPVITGGRSNTGRGSRWLPVYPKAHPSGRGALDGPPLP
jgi:hypothetical protein